MADWGRVPRALTYRIRRLADELGEWWRAILRVIPGELGCSARRRLYGFHAGAGTRVLPHVLIYYPSKLKTGTNVAIASYSQLNANGGIEIGNDVLIGPGCLIWSQNHAYDLRDVPIREQGYRLAKVTIEDDVWIAGGATVLPGVRLGRGSVVAAGAVVTRSTEPNSIVAGVPARRIGDRASPERSRAAGERGSAASSLE